MKDISKIQTIEEFWKAFKHEVLEGEEKPHVDLIRSIFFTACSGMYAMTKFNVFESGKSMPEKIEFMKSIEKEIREFNIDLDEYETDQIKH